MAEDEKETPEGEEPEEEELTREELEEEVSELRERVEELEEQLAERGGEETGAARWAGWILGTLVGATSLALIVVIIGGGWPWPCECEEPGAASPQGPDDQQRQQADLERLLREHSADFQRCFESWASSHSEELHPGWAVIVRLEIDADQGGTVQQVEASGERLPRPLGDCLESRVQLWTFPGPGPYTMELPFAIEGDPSQFSGGGRGQQGPATDAGAAGADGGAAGDGAPAAIE